MAQLNLERTEVRAPVNGIVTNLDLQAGDYVAAGRAGDRRGRCRLLPRRRLFRGDQAGPDPPRRPRHGLADGRGPAFDGHVEGIASAIVDRERSGSANLLANVNPTFTWVRLAQRIPVRIAIDRVPPGIQLIAGRTATVVIEPLPGSGTP